MEFVVDIGDGHVGLRPCIVGRCGENLVPYMLVDVIVVCYTVRGRLRREWLFR
jgi:hypothetical protein